MKSATDMLRLDPQLCFPLYAASRLVTRLYQPLLEPLGLTYPQYVVLLILWEDAPCSVSHVGKRAMLNTNTLTPVLKRLEQLGYVLRSRRTDDERVVEIGLTKAGLALKKQCAHVPRRLYQSIDYPEGKALALKRALEEFIGILQASSSSIPIEE
jgi:DNA-binding MarR family transcriptional regulator